MRSLLVCLLGTSVSLVAVADQSPLFEPASMCFRSMVDNLLRAGYSPYVWNESGQRPLDVTQAVHEKVFQEELQPVLAEKKKLSEGWGIFDPRWAGVVKRERAVRRRLEACVQTAQGFREVMPHFWRQGSPPINTVLQAQRHDSSVWFPTPRVISLETLNGELLWQWGDPPPRLRAGQWILLKGMGLGGGPDVDYSKILLGGARVLEKTLTMYEGAVDALKRLRYEKVKPFDQWAKGIQKWTDEQIIFRVPEVAVSGELVVSVQKRVGTNPSFYDPLKAHSVWDPLTERFLREPFDHASDVVSRLSGSKTSEPFSIVVVNPERQDRVKRGEAIFWSYDFNIGQIHNVMGLDWGKSLRRPENAALGVKGNSWDLFGAIPISAGEVPEVVKQNVYFNPFPMPMPLKPLVLGDSLKKGWTKPTGYVGYVYAESVNPITGFKEEKIGFSCASCHAHVVEFERAPGQHVKKVFPGIPNPQWSMKWSVLGDVMGGVKGKERNTDGVEESVDKSQLVWSVPHGAGEHSLIHPSFDGSPYANDHLFSPITIPMITRHLPVRRALSRTELIAGFEGSYVHSEEPDGAFGSMLKEGLIDLTAYMSSLDRNDHELNHVGLYRWMKEKRTLDLVENASEGEFLESSWRAYPELSDLVNRGKNIYDSSCVSCHQYNFGTNSDESMWPITQMGTYFSPTIYQRETQSIRTAIMRNLYWIAQRGLLHDGHVKTLEDLVHPARLQPGSEMHTRYYTLHPGTFRVKKGTREQERALRAHAYFVDVPWETDHLYWDYQKMRAEFGRREFGLNQPLSLPEAPHPYAVATQDVQALVAYLLTL